MTKIVNSPILIYKTKLIISNNYIYLKKFNFVLPVCVCNLSLEMGTIILNFLGKKSFFKGVFLISVSWFTKKLKFKHKLSWFFFKRRFLKLFIYQIGKSHYMFQPLPVYLIRKKRYTNPNSLIFFGINWVTLNIYCHKIKQALSINPYTLRGLRFGRQQLYKRQGKISKYSGLKSKIF